MVTGHWSLVTFQRITDQNKCSLQHLAKVVGETDTSGQLLGHRQLARLTCASDVRLHLVCDEHVPIGSGSADEVAELVHIGPSEGQ